MSTHNQSFSTLEEESLICARCGYCRSVCPVYKSIGLESATPRGKISIAREVFPLKKHGKMTDDFVNRVTQCTLCGACSRACATDIEIRNLWLDLRGRINRMGKSPRGYTALHRNLVSNRNITTFDNRERLDWAQDLDDPEALESRKGADVCYFVGCVSSFMPQASEVAIAFSEILVKAGVDFTTLGGEEWCCGFPLIGTGSADDARQFMKHNVERIKELGIHTMVATCPSCHHVWSHSAAEFLDGYELKVFHATEFVLSLIREGKIKPGELNEKITYHDPCDLGRNGGIFEAPRDIIKSIPGVEFVEMEHHHADSLCCGGGGNLQTVDPELTNAIAAMRTKEIAQSGASIVVSACQQCEQVLSASIRKAGLPVRVMNITQLVLEVI